MKLKIGKTYINKSLQTIIILGDFPSGGVTVFYDQYNRFYFEDGAVTSPSLCDEFNIIGET